MTCFLRSKGQSFRGLVLFEYLAINASRSASPGVRRTRNDQKGARAPEFPFDLPSVMRTLIDQSINCFDASVRLEICLIQQTGSARAVMGNPIKAVAWLVNKLHEFGVSLQPGDVILSGSFIRAAPFGPGDTLLALFDLRPRPRAVERNRQSPRDRTATH